MSAAGNPARPGGRTVPLLIGLAVGAFALVVRFATKSPLWLDEALSVDIARLPLGSIPEALRHDGHPPLYYFLLHGWMSVFGGSDVAVRALSGVFAVAALPLAWLAGRRAGGDRLAWATAFVLALLPFAVRYSTETRMYSLVTLLVLAGQLLVRRVVDAREAPLPAVAGVAGVVGLLLLTHYWSIYLVGATVLVVAWWARRGDRAARIAAARLAGATAVGGLLFVPWLPSFLSQAAHTGTPWAGAARPTVVLNETLRDFGGGGTRAETGLLAALLAVLVLAGLFGRDAEDDAVPLALGRPSGAVAGEAAVAALTLAIGTVAGILTASTFAGRYASVILPLVVLVVARGLVVLPRPWPALAAGAAFAGLAAIGIAGNLVDERTQARDLVAAIAPRFRAGDVIVDCPDQLGPATRRAVVQAGIDPGALVVYPTLGDGDLVDWRDYRERNDAADPAAVAGEIARRVAPGGSVWVVWSGSYRTLEGDCEALVASLAAQLGTGELVVQDGASRYFEHATLVRFGGA
jgi:hypothetical protein